MQVNIIRKPAPIDKIQIELSENEASILSAMLQIYFRNCFKDTSDYSFLKELLDKLYYGKNLK